MPYPIRTADEAARDLRRLPGHVRQRAIRLIRALADDPRPSSAKELRELPGRYRIRLDGWRLIYSVSDDPPGVLILRVRRKRGGANVYKGLE